MNLDWIDDILAVIDAGSLVEAAQRRFLTQSAFARRVRALEDKLGTPLFDRDRKPVTVLPGVLALEPDLRELSARLRRLRLDLASSSQASGGALTLACQHALTMSVSPWIVKRLTMHGDASVRVRSGNRDECLMLLLSGEVDFLVTYENPDARKPALPGALDSAFLGTDLLVPVCTPQLREQLDLSTMPMIGYPPNVFLGRVFNHHIAPRIADGISTILKAETALTLAACNYALNGIGVAWLPLTMVSDHVANGTLCQIDDSLPTQELSITMNRRSGERNTERDALWQHLISDMALPQTLERLPDEPTGPVQPVE